MSDPLGRLLAEHGHGGTATIPVPPTGSGDPLDALLAEHTGSSGAAPTLPPIPVAQAEGTYRGPTKANPQATKLTGPARILTQYLAQPMVDNPVATVASFMAPPLAIAGAASMAKDAIEYTGQKAAELSLPAHERALAEADPNRIPGERAAVETGMLAAPLLIHAGIKSVKEGRAIGKEVAKGTDAASVRQSFLDQLTPEEQAHAKADPHYRELFGDAPAQGPNMSIAEPPIGEIRRRLGQPPAKPVEPSKDAEGVTAGTGRLEDYTPEQRAFRARLAAELGLEGKEQIGEIRRRAVEQPAPPVEPGPEVQPYSTKSTTILRRPGATEIVPPELPVETPTIPPEGPRLGPERLAEPYSTPAPDPAALRPAVSASAEKALVRPDIQRAVNKALPNETPTPVEPPAPATPIPGTPEPRPSDILNVAKLNLTDQTAQQRVAAQLEQFRALRESNKQTFNEADVNRAEIVKELVSGDGKALDPTAAKRLSGEELLARRDVVRQNDQLIDQLSKQIESKQLSVEDHAQAVDLLNKAVNHNDALLSDLVTGSSQKGRDLNLLRRMANRSLDPDVWLVQAKRMLGDRPLTDEISAAIRKLATEAAEACGGA